MFSRLIGDERAAISIIAALSLAVVIGVSALAVEFGHGLLLRSENQRVADLAAYGGGLVYNSTGSATEAASAAANIAALNGNASGTTASLVTSPTGDSNQALETSVTTSMPLYLARLFTNQTSLSIGATAYAELKASAPGCIIALSSAGSGISLSGGTSVTADNCSVASNSAVTLVGGTKITTKVVDYSTSYSVSGGSSIVTPSGGSPTYSKTTTADPLAGNGAVSTAAARINTVAGIQSPTLSSVPSGTNITFDSGGKKSTTVSSLTTIGCSTTSTGSPWAVTCSGIGPFKFGTVTINGGVSVTINNSSSGVTYDFGGTINGGSSNGLIFNGGSGATYNIAGGIVAGGSVPLSFSAGTFNIGTTTCNGTSGYSICISGSGNLTIAGPSTFVLAGGIYQDASGNPGSPPTALTLGYGTTTNIFDIGKASDGNSLNNANGATLLGDAEGATTVTCGSSTSTFCMAGGVTTTGGTCVALGAAAEHDIDGNLDAAGGIFLGAGIYTLDGYVALGNSGGGDVSNCPSSGTTTGLSATGVTLVVSGTNSVTCNGVASSAFCLGAGYRTVDLTAPASGATADLAVIGPQSASYPDAAAFTTGAIHTQISGAFYFPHGPVTMSGAASLADAGNPNACLELIGTQVTLAGGSAAASTCTGLGSGSTGSTVALVQ